MPTTPIDNSREFPDDPSQPPLEMAYVLFMDIVAYSRAATDIQQQSIDTLKRLVRETPEFQRASEGRRVISLPTGDGMALAFFGDPRAPVQCAVEVSRALRTFPQIPVRMGMHAGPVFRVKDITGNENVAGDGINMAQRVMDCGDAGHLLVSKSLADVLNHLSGWKGSFTDLGVVAVKHGVMVHIFNLCIDGVGNAELPQKLRRSQPSEFRRRLRVAIIAVAALLAVAAALAFAFRATLLPRMSRKPTVAVLGFSNMRATPDTDWVGVSLREMLTTELEAGGAAHTVAGEKVASAKISMALPENVTYGPETLDRLRRTLNCDYIIYGSVDDPGKSMGGRVRADVHLQNVSSGEMLASWVESDNEEKLGGLASRLGSNLRSKLGLPEVVSDDRRRIQASMPASQDAQKAYSEGLRQLRSFDLLSARDSFLKSIAADASFPLSHAYLSEAWSKLGYDERARAEAKTAFDLSENLLREDKLLVEARYRQSNSEWEKAVDLYRALWNFAPDDPEYALRAAGVQTRAGKGSDALATIAEVRSKVPEAAQDARIDLSEAEAFEALGDSRKAADAAQRAAQKAQSVGARLLEAEALWRVCGGLKDVGDTAAAVTACNRSAELAKATGDQLLVARALTNLGHILEAQGDPAKALQLHQQALQIARKLGSQRDVAGALGNIGNLFSDQGNHEAAQKSYLDALQVATEANDRNAILLLQNDLAGEKEITGDFAAALDFYEKSRATALATGEKSGEANALSNISRLQILRGDLASALSNIQQALELSEKLGLQEKSVSIRGILGDVLLQQGNLAGAEKSYRDALEASRKLGDKMDIASAKLSLAVLAIEKEDWANASPLAQEAAAEFKAENNPDMESSAYLVLADAAVGLKNFPDAQSHLERAQALKSSDPAIQLSVALTSARILACTGKLSAAQKLAAEVSARAQQSGMLLFQLRTTLVTGEFGLCGASRASSRSILHSLQVTASSKGYRLIERASARVLEQMT